MNTRRLLALANKLDTVPRKQFNICKWVGHDWKGKPDLSCGTVACAMGWATTMPLFRKLGLRLDLAPDPAVWADVVIKTKSGVYVARDGYESARTLFDIDDDTATSLFSGSEYRRDERTGEVDTQEVTPKRVAKKIRKVVAEYKRKRA